MLEAILSQIIVTRIHFAHDPFESLGGLLRIGDNRRNQVRNAFVNRQFHALGINQDHAHLLGRRTHHDRRNHRIHEARLTGTRLASDQHVRSLCEVRDNVPAFDVLTHADDQRMLVTHSSAGTQYVTQRHVFAVSVRNFNADR